MFSSLFSFVNIHSVLASNWKVFPFEKLKVGGGGGCHQDYTLPRTDHCLKAAVDKPHGE